MAQLAQDRLVRKEVALGQIREIAPPLTHVGLREIAPFLPVESDDVIFQYVVPDVDGLAPARAEDAESELAMKDDTIGSGRASLIDWALKDHYDPSDVSRYREYLRIAELTGGQSFPLTVGRMTEDFPAKLARDARIRRRKLDNRIEWLIWKGLEDGEINYNDGKVKFSVNFGRPADQTNQEPEKGWDTDEGDPIGDLLAVQEYMEDEYSITIDRAWTSKKVLRNILNSKKFIARTGLAPTTGVDPRYVIDGWGVEAAVAVVERATGIKLNVHDGVYRTRALGSTTTVNHRFLSEDKIVFLPSENDIAELAETEIGFAKTLTSPHPEGNWTSGYYEWEKEGVDPWGLDRGTGIKAFPVFPHLELTYTLKVIGLDSGD